MRHIPCSMRVLLSTIVIEILYILQLCHQVTGMILSIKFSLENILNVAYTVQKMKFSVKDFFSKCNQIRGFLRTWSHLLKKSLIENFIYCAVYFIGLNWIDSTM